MTTLRKTFTGALAEAADRVNRQKGTPVACGVTLYHRPRPAQIDVHHIWPLGVGGPNLPANRIAACGGCHEAIHKLLREYDRVQGLPAWSVRRRFPRGVQRVAALGWDRITRHAL